MLSSSEEHWNSVSEKVQKTHNTLWTNPIHKWSKSDVCWCDAFNWPYMISVTFLKATSCNHHSKVDKVGTPPKQSMSVQIHVELKHNLWHISTPSSENEQCLIATDNEDNYQIPHRCSTTKERCKLTNCITDQINLFMNINIQMLRNRLFWDHAF